MGPSSLQLAARRIQRQNSGNTAPGYKGDHSFDLGSHRMGGNSAGIQDMGFLSADENVNSHDGSQVSDGKQSKSYY